MQNKPRRQRVRTRRKGFLSHVLCYCVSFWKAIYNCLVVPPCWPLRLTASSRAAVDNSPMTKLHPTRSGSVSADDAQQMRGTTIMALDATTTADHHHLEATTTADHHHLEATTTADHHHLEATTAADQHTSRSSTSARNGSATEKHQPPGFNGYFTMPPTTPGGNGDAAMPPSAPGREGFLASPATFNFRYQPPTGQKCRVFISHSGFQKQVLVDLIMEAFRDRYPALKDKVFMDERSLQPRARHRSNAEEIFGHLADAFVVVVILSKEFVRSPWPMAELHYALMCRRAGSPVVVLPVLYELTFDQLKSHMKQLHQSSSLTGGPVATATSTQQEQIEDLTEVYHMLNNRLQPHPGGGTPTVDPSTSVASGGSRGSLDGASLGSGNPDQQPGALGQSPDEDGLRRRSVESASPSRCSVDSGSELSRSSSLEGQATEWRGPGVDGILQQWALFNVAVLRELVSSNTGLRRDQASWVTEMRDKVVDHTISLLWELGQMPTRASVQLPDILVGMSLERVQSVIDRLVCMATGRPVLLLLHGMGGLGKTTLAKAVFRELWRQHQTVPCCFLEMGAARLREQELVERQLRLLKELAQVKHLDLGSVEAGQIEILERLSGKRVLLVVDNVWHGQLDQLLPAHIMDVLADGSMVLVTSRDLQRTLQSFKDATPHAVDAVRVLLLGQEASSELLRRHAKRSGGLPEDLDSQTLRPVLRRCGGLPMALEVVGRYLRYCDTEKPQGLQRFLAELNQPDDPLRRAFSQQFAQKTTAGADRTLFTALRLSWDLLDQDMQETLQDIVWELRHQPVHLLEAYCKRGHLPRLQGLGLLQNLAADTEAQQEDGQPCALVHDTIVDFCSVLADAEDAARMVVQDLEDLDAIVGPSCRGIFLQPFQADEGPHPTIDIAAVFRKTKHLRKLRILRSHVQATGGALLLQLHPRWLEIKRALVSSIQFERARQVAGGPPREQLTVLVLENLPNLERLDGLLDCPSLKALTLTNLPRLRALQLANLPRLQHATIAYCSPGLRRLELTDLPALAKLVVSNCTVLPALPDTLGELLSLAVLEVPYCKALSGLPDSLGQLTQLQTLYMEGCTGLLALPDSLGNLASLTRLDIEGCTQLRSLPPTLGALASLRDLTLWGCVNLAHLPPAVGALSALTSLDLDGCASLPDLPAELCQLSALQILRAAGCSRLHHLPHDLGHLDSLQELYLEGCSSLQALPASTTRLTNLRVLDLGGNAQLRELPVNLGRLTALTRVDLTGCRSLQEVPASAGSLPKLELLMLAQCERLRRLPRSCGGLTSLRVLDVRSTPRLGSLPRSLEALPSLQYVNTDPGRKLWPLLGPVLEEEEQEEEEQELDDVRVQDQGPGASA